MAKKHHKHHRPGTSGGRPILVGTTPQPTTINGQLYPQTIGGAEVTLFSNHPRITVSARLRGPVTSPLPQPRIDTVNREGRVSLTRWAGRDPYVIVLPIMFSSYPHGPVEDDIRALSSLAVRHGNDTEPPIVQIAGPVPFPPGLKDPKWRVSRLEEIQDRTVFNDSGIRSRLAVDVTLIEYVVDRWFIDSADDSASTGFGAGIRNRKVTMRKGETFYDLARRVYHDRSRAKEIARANGIPLGYRAPKDTTVRLP